MVGENLAVLELFFFESVDILPIHVDELIYFVKKLTEAVLFFNTAETDLTLVHPLQLQSFFVLFQGQTLKMNSSFSAFQIKGSPEPQTDIRKHIRLKKSMSLPDDTLEYWGFYLPNGSTVSLSVCSR